MLKTLVCGFAGLNDEEITLKILKLDALEIRFVKKKKLIL